jgi:ATP-dependent HslUV protease subunit HslV
LAIGGDCQVSIGQTIVKANARRLRLGKGDVIGGFAARPRMRSRCSSSWSQARAIRVSAHRAAVGRQGLATDRYLRRLGR